LRILTLALSVVILVASCAEPKPVTEIDNRKQELPEGSKSVLLSYNEENKPLIDSSFNTKANDIAPAIFIENLSGYNGYLDYCAEKMYSENHTKDIRASRYLTQGDFRKNTDSLLFFSYLTDYIESVSFISPNEGYISLSHAPESDFVKNAGLMIDNIGGGTDIFKFTLNPNSKDFGQLIGIEEVNSEFWDSHPYAYTKVIGRDTVTLLVWSSDNKRGQAYTEAIYSDGKKKSLNDTDLYYLYLINDQPSSRPKKIENDVSVIGANDGSPFAHCLCENTNWLFFSSNRNNSAENYDLYSVKIKTDFNSQTLEIIGSPEQLPNDSQEIKDSRDSVIYSIPSSINSQDDERFPYVLNSSTGNPVMYFSSDRLASKTAIDKDTYIQSIGGYDIYKFELDEKYNCVPEPEPTPDYFLEVSFLESNPGNAKVDGQIIVEGAQEVSPGRFKLSPGECYEVKAMTEEDNYKINQDGTIDHYYYPAVLTTDYSEVAYNILDTVIDSMLSTDAYRLNRIASSTKYDTIIRITETESGYDIKENIYRRTVYDNGFSLVGDKFRLSNTIYDSTVVFAKIIPSSEDDFVLRDEEKISGQEISSVKTTLNQLCIKDKPTSNQVTIYDTVWVSRRTRSAPTNSLVLTVIDACDPSLKIVDPILEITDNRGNIFRDSSNRLVIDIKPDRIYNMKGGSFQGNVNCEVYDDRILHGYEKWDANCDITSDYIYGASVNSKLRQLDTKGFVNDTVIYDTVFLKSHTSPKPPCSVAFTSLKGVNKNVPYFQTAYWEVNTTQNLGSYEEPGTHLYYLGGKGYGSDHPLSQKSSFIELHPRGQYFPLWRGEETVDRRKRINEYKSYAETVDQNLNRIAENIAKVRIPQFQDLRDINPEYDYKLLIELEAMSDRRPVRKGYYTGDISIEYTQAEYNTLDGTIDTERVVIPPGSKLGLDNDTLSKLRAWFGYQELFDRLKEFDVFNEKLYNDQVLLPKTNNTDDAYSDLEDFDIIITTKGNFIDSESKADIKNYDRENRDNSFFVYDSTRKVNIVVRALIYVDGKLLEPDCCNSNKSQKLITVEQYRKSYMKEEDIE
jgi:hypothetical protein